MFLSMVELLKGITDKMLNCTINSDGTLWNHIYASESFLTYDYMLQFVSLITVNTNLFTHI